MNQDCLNRNDLNGGSFVSAYSSQGAESEGNGHDWADPQTL